MFSTQFDTVGGADHAREAFDGPTPGGVDEPESVALLAAAFSLFRATERLAELDAESRAVARLAAEALMRGDVSCAALALVARVEGRSGIVELLRGSAQSQPH